MTDKKEEKERREKEGRQGKKRQSIVRGKEGVYTVCCYMI